MFRGGLKAHTIAGRRLGYCIYYRDHLAYRLVSPVLEALRQDLAQAFSPWLTAQDRAAYRPHITVQNMAESAEARDLLERLQMDFEPFEIVAEGLLLWRYLGGPWALVNRFDFAAPRG